MENVIKDKLKQYFDSYAKAWPLSGVFLVVKDDEVLFKKAYGEANKELDVLNNLETKFLICSITKSFTSTAIMLLHDRGLLNVNDKLSKFLPDYGEAAEKITIYHLLTHTSGISSYTNEEGFVGKTERLVFTQDELVNRFKNKPLEFEPGEKGEYCNAGYYLLGLIIEKVSGLTYDEFLQENIFKPLGMSNSGLYHQDKVIKNRAYPYTVKGDTYANGRFVEMVNVYAGGALYSTVDDMLLWHNALLSGKLVSKESLELMLTPYRKIDEVIPYGCGFFVTEIFGKKRVGHEGGLNGFLTQYYHFPEENLTYIILGNVIQNIWKISDDIPAIVFGEKYNISQEHTRYDIDLDLLNDFVGSYKSSRGSLTELSIENGKVYLDLYKSNKFEIIPVSQNRFVHKLIEEYYEFEKDENGEYYFKYYGSKSKKVM